MQWNFTNQDLEGIRIFCRHYTESTFCCCYTYTKLGMKTNPSFLFIMFEIKYKTLFWKTIEIRKTFRDRDTYIRTKSKYWFLSSNWLLFLSPSSSCLLLYLYLNWIIYYIADVAKSCCWSCSSPFKGQKNHHDFGFHQRTRCFQINSRGFGHHEQDSGNSDQNYWCRYFATNECRWTQW